MKKLAIALCLAAQPALAFDYIKNADGGQIEIYRGELYCADDDILAVTPPEKHRDTYLAMGRLKSGQVVITGCAMIGTDVRIIWKEFGYDTWTYTLIELNNPNPPRHAISNKIDWNAARRWQAPSLDAPRIPTDTRREMFK